MKWAEARLPVATEVAEAVAAAFLEAGSAGTATLPGDAVGQVAVVGYFPVDDGLDARLVDLRRRLRHLRAAGIAVPTSSGLSLRPLADEAWATAWRAYFRPQRVGERILVVPGWEQPEPRAGDVVVRIDPGQAFGTGSHPTTRLCLAALENHLRAGDRVLDWGTGSGILAIAATLLGAREVLAVDVDPIAVEAARANVQANDVADRVVVVHGDLVAVPTAGGPFDLAVANIVAEVIAGGAAQLAERVRPDGRLITGGVVAAPRKLSGLVEGALAGAGFVPLEVTREEEWVTTVYRSRRSRDAAG
ncbi:MAG: 50S ribosomal protein L11 methyltransferase [Armatimonadetes bacterium]|nr:50S ribosomal protein L11 methyltransferase [Armatimonadota bacterium]